MLLQSQESQHKRAFAAVVRASEVFARLSAQRHELRRLCDAAPIFENDNLIGPGALILAWIHRVTPGVPSDPDV